MKGSEKQIAWAENIIEEARTKNQRTMDEAKKRYDAEGEAGEGLYNLRKMVYEIITEVFTKLDDAKWVIDNRANLITAILIASSNKVDTNMMKTFFKTPRDFMRWV